MMHDQPQLFFWVPGLLGPVPPEVAVGAGLAELTKIFNRADCQSVEVAEGCAMRACQHAVPLTVLTYLADYGQLPEQRYMRCDPVHLKAGMDQAFLFDGRHFEIEAGEAQALIESLNEHLAAEKLSIKCKHPKRWYLGMADQPAINTVPLDQVVSKNINPYLPQGRGASYWNRIMTEMQMLLYQHPVNVARQSRGETVINGAWLYGDTELPLPVDIPYQKIYADSLLAEGMAHYAQIPFARWPTGLDQAGCTHGNVLLAYTAFQEALLKGELQQWQVLLQGFAEQWMRPVWEQLRAAKLSRVIIEPGDGKQYIISSQQAKGFRFRPFWRAEKSFQNYIIQQHSES